MITKFHLVDGVGKVLGEGEETASGVYRFFSDAFANGYKEFETLEEMFAECGGIAIQPQMFQTPARPRQLDLFNEETNGGGGAVTRP